jgi:hypothetical protein
VRTAWLVIVAGCGGDRSAGSDASIGTWSTVSIGAPAAVSLRSIHASGATDIWIAGGVPLPGSDALTDGSFVVERDGTSWSPAAITGQAVWAFAPNDAWVAGFGQKLANHWDGSAWSPQQLGDNRTILSFWGTTARDLWGVEPSPGYLGHYDGATWTHDIDLDGAAIFATSDGNVWACGGGHVLHWMGASGPTDANAFELSIVPTLHALAGTAADDVWAAGDGGALEHRDGTAWTAVDSPTTAVLRGLASAARDDAWAVGDGGAIVHFDGTAWSAIASPTTATLRAVWAIGRGDVWAVGDGGVVVHCCD